MRPRLSVLTVLSSLALAGCGGSGRRAGASVDTLGPQITLAWAARSRVFAAPSASTAALVTFPGAGANGADVSEVVLRPSGADAAAKTYQLGFAVHPGRHLVRVDFLADASQTYTPLATAALNVLVTGTGELRSFTGTPLGTIAYGSKVSGVALQAGQQLELGQTSDLTVDASTLNGYVALSPGSVSFRIVSGEGTLTLNADGSVTGVEPGTATLVPTVDGVSGEPTAVTVLGAAVAARVVSVASTDLVADPVRGVLWVAPSPSSANPNPDSIASLDPATGTLGAPIALGGAPSALAISDDGSTLYAGLQDLGTVRRVDLATRVAGSSFALPNSGFGFPTYATDLAVQPGSVSTLALTRSDQGDSGYNGPAIFDDGVERPKSLGIYQGFRVLWTAPDRIVSYQYASGSDGLEDVAVDGQGATLMRTVSTQANLFKPLVLAGGRLYSANGVVTDATSLAPVGAFPQPDSLGLSRIFSGPAVDVARRRAYYFEVGYSGETPRIHVYDTATFAEIANHRITGLTVTNPPFNGFAIRMSLVGNDQLAFRLSDQVVILDDVSGL